MSEKNNLILLRGLPGSGKTTFAELISEQGKYPTYSVDDYFTNPETGDYEFDHKTNYLAYKQCEKLTEQRMQEHSPKIIVHNTFTMDWELEPYFKLAAKYDYTVFIATIEKYHTNTNTHNVSDEQLQRMAEKYKVKLI